MLKRLFQTAKYYKSTYKIPQQTDFINSFSELQIPQIASRFLGQFPNPTQIQSKSMKIILGGNDLVGIAPTGSGKTIAFAVPTLIKAAATRKENARPFVSTVIICPTRELSNQIYQTINPLAKSFRLRVANLYGGTSKYAQFDQAKYANILVATPGRLADYASTGSKLNKVEHVILDEADQMLELNFEDELVSILDKTPKQRQTLLFSATWDPDIQLLAGDYTKQGAYYVQVGNNSMSINPNIQQHFRLSSPDKIKPTIANLLNNHADSKVLIFCNSKIQTRDLANELNDMTQRPITFITSDLTQQQRASTMKKFRESVGGVMVATNVVSRGIDVKDIQLVINYGFPSQNADFIHRIGRTGRGGKTGKSLTFIFKGNSRIQKNLKYIRDLFVNQNLPIPKSLQQIIEQIGLKISDSSDKKTPLQKKTDGKTKQPTYKKKQQQEQSEEEEVRPQKVLGRYVTSKPATGRTPVKKVIKKKRDSDSDDDD